MNNNMPNNFNNGLPNDNNSQNNSFPNPTANAANEQLAGGQSTVGNGPSIMQGVPNAQNEPGIVQGVNDVPNIPNVMQGNVAPQKPEPAPTMPGQGNSGINAYTMQKEEVKKEEPGVVSIPSFAPNIPEKKPEPQIQPQNPNLNMNINNQVSNNPMNSVNPEPTMLNSLNNQIGTPNVNIIKEPVMPNAPEQQPINQNPNGLGQTNNQNLNSFPFGNVNQANNGQPQNANVVPPVVNGPSVDPKPTMPNSLNNQIGGMDNTNMKPGLSQVGQTELNSIDNDVVEMPEMPNKKFPLSVREMVLIGIAFVGIIAVIIVYWP